MKSKWSSYLLTVYFAVNMAGLAAQKVVGTQQVIPVERDPLMESHSQAAIAIGANQMSSVGVAVEGIGGADICSGSLLSIQTMEEHDLDNNYRVDEKGNINLPFVGIIHLDGLKVTDAELLISDRLKSSGILKNAHVFVRFVEYNAPKISVMGEVKSPGRFPLLESRTLYEVLAMAGGWTELSGDEIDLHRRDQDPAQEEKVKYKRGIGEMVLRSVKVNPGDTVFVKRAGIVYVLGSVVRPGGYPMQEDGHLNVAQALSLAMGPTQDAKTNSIRILRKQEDGQVVSIKLKYKQIKNGKDATVELKGEDIVFVPNSRLKDSLEYAKSIFSSASSAAIYVYR